MNHRTDFETFEREYVVVRRWVDDASDALKIITDGNRNAAGFLKSEVRYSAAYKNAKTNFDLAFRKSQLFLKGVPNEFMRRNSKYHK